MKERINKFRELNKKDKLECLIKWGILVFVAVILVLFVFVKKCYLKYTETGLDYTTAIRAGIIIGMSCLIPVIAFVKNSLNDKWNKIVSFAFFFASPVIIYFSLEFFHEETFLIEIFKIRKLCLLLNVIIVSMVVVLICIVTNKIKASIIGAAIITSLFGAVNYYVYNFRGVSIVASDVFSTETAASVAKDYHLFLDSNIFFLLIATLLIITAAWKLRDFPVLPSFKLRIPAIIGYGVVCGIFLQVFVLSGQLASWGINIKLYRPYEAYKKYGSLVSVVRTIGYIMVEEPEGYSVEQIQQIADSYSTDTGTGQTPNLIVIMDEAFSDLQTINEFPISEDYMPFIRSLSENTIKGNAYVSIFGGNTANSEFEFLTNNSMGLLPANTVPYQLFIKDKFPSIVYSLESQNYAGNIGLHPYKPNGFNRASVYPMLGFQDFITLESFNQDNKLRGKVTDETDFDKIIEEYEKSKSTSSQPFFVFNVTMQNHGGYSSDDPNFQQKIQILDDYYYDDYTQNYLSLIKYTDEAVEQLITYFEQVDEPTVIIFFGDHRPGLRQEWYEKLFGKSENEMTSEELMAKYEVPFFAWANYDIPEENVDKISMNYLSAYLFDKLGLQLTKYQQYVLDVQEQVPVMNTIGYWGSDGKFYDYKDTTSPYYDVISEYRNVQYNNIHDRGNRVDSMFYLEQ